MRITSSLCKTHIGRRFKQLWEVKKNISVFNVAHPVYGKYKNVQIEDAAELKFEVLPPRPDYFQFNAKQTFQMLEPKPKPRLKKVVYGFNGQKRLVAGLRQAQVLTKTAVANARTLPQGSFKFIHSRIPIQDTLVERYIMQSHKWNPANDLLPLRFHRHSPGWKFKPEYGILEKDIRKTLLMNMVRLCGMIDAQKNPDAFEKKRVSRHHTLSFQYTCNGYPVIIQANSEWVVSGASRLRVNAKLLPKKSSKKKVPSTNPISPVISLRRCQQYADKSYSGWADGFKFPYTHTLILSESKASSLSQMRSKALMYCFAHAGTMAREMYGDDVTMIPVPIKVQCIQTNGIDFYFTVFLLNTLNFTSNEGDKNMVWFSKKFPLFRKTVPRKAMLRHTTYTAYKPEPFGKFLALYMNSNDVDL